jgi:hypothetical protein
VRPDLRPAERFVRVARFRLGACRAFGPLPVGRSCRNAGPGGPGRVPLCAGLGRPRSRRARDRCVRHHYVVLGQRRRFAVHRRWLRRPLLWPLLYSPEPYTGSVGMPRAAGPECRRPPTACSAVPVRGAGPAGAQRPCLFRSLQEGASKTPTCGRRATWRRSLAVPVAVLDPDRGEECMPRSTSRTQRRRRSQALKLSCSNRRSALVTVSAA